MDSPRVYTGKPVESRYHSVPAVVVSEPGLVFVSGQAGWDDNAVIVGPEDPALQARGGFDNIEAIATLTPKP